MNLERWRDAKVRALASLYGGPRFDSWSGVKLVVGSSLFHVHKNSNSTM